MRKSGASLVIAWLLGSGAGFAQYSQGLAPGAADQQGPPSTAVPPQLADVTLEQRLDAQMPAGATFRDEDGRTVRLGDYFGAKPIVLTFVYFQCPMLCNQVMSDLTSALGVVKFDAARDYTVIAVSFDPRDTPEGARVKKAAFLERYKRPGTEDGWHYLTGDEANIRLVTEAAGFKYRFDAVTGQFAHAAGVLVLTPGGRISRVFYGLEYAPKALQFAIIESSDGKIGTPADKLLLYCFHYDPATGKYGLMTMRLVRLGAVATMAGLGAFMLVMWRRDRRQAAPTGRVSRGNRLPADD